MKKGFVSWSGGKDCSYSMHHALKSGYEIKFLLNMVQNGNARCAWHGLKNDVLKAQAEAIGIPIIQEDTTFDSYEEDFKKVCRKFKEDGVEYGIFGDIDIAEHREWVEHVCGDAGIKSVFPLWMKRQTDIINDFINDGFKAIIISVKNDMGINKFLGSYIDKDLIDKMRKMGISACGEHGEFHTIVTDGHYFKKELKVSSGHRYTINNYEFFDIDELILEENKS